MCHYNKDIPFNGIKELTIAVLKNTNRRENLLMKRLLDIKETANFLGLGVYTIREFVWERRLQPIQFNRNGKLLFDINDLEKLISENKKRV